MSAANDPSQPASAACPECCIVDAWAIGVFDQLDDGILIVDGDRCVRWANTAWLGRYGLVTPGEPLATCLKRLGNPSKRVLASLDRQLDRVLATADSEGHRLATPIPLGKGRMVSLTLTCCQGPGGCGCLLLGSEDPAPAAAAAPANPACSTAIEEAEAQEALSFDVLAHAIDATVVIVQNNRAVYLNRCGQRILGYDPAEIGDTPFEEFIHPDHRQQVRDRLDAPTPAEGRTQETKVLTRAGDTRWLLSTARPIAYSGRPAILYTAVDVTEQKRAKEVLALASERLNLAIRGGRLGTWDIDLRSGAVICNARQAEMLGYRLWEYPATPAEWERLLHPADRARVLEAVGKSIEGATDDLQVEYRLKTGQGDWKWVLVQGCVVEHDDQGRPIRMAGVQMDISERKRLEAHVLEAAEAERRRIGRDLHDGLGQLLSGLAYMGGALRRKLQNAEPALADDAAALAAELSGAVEVTRSLSRGMNACLTDQTFGEVLQDLADGVSRLFGVRCRLQCAETLPACDPQCCLNLYRIAQEAVANAVRHGRADEVLLRLDVQENEVVMEVQDNGVGISEDGGAHCGMGLDTMKYRAGVIGGQLHVTAGPEGGTNVLCRVPVRASDAATEGIEE